MMKASKLLSIILAIALVFTLCAGVMAADKNDSITVTGTKAGETYNLYQMFTLEVDSETTPKAYTYKVTPEWKGFFTENGFGATYVTISNDVVTWNDGKNNEADMKALAKEAAKYADGKTKIATEQGDNGSIVFDNLENGYYLITSTLGTFAMIETTPDKEKVTINEKNPDNTITKEVKEDSSDTFGKSNNAQIGDTVEFKSEINLLPGTRNVVVTDTMSSGLTLNNNSIAITGLTANQEYDLNTNPGNGKTFTITFKETYLNALAESTTLTLTYSAVLNKNAVNTDGNGVAIVEQNNEIVLTYGNGQSIESKTTTTTHKFSVFKHAEGATNHLAGAVFSLKKGDKVVNLVKLDDKNYRVAKDGETGTVETTFTTVATGDIVIWGVDADSDYALEEITPPAGYNKLAKAVTVTVDANNNTRIDVVNNTGAELPSTGGMGTTLFYVLGAILVLGAAVILVVRRRMRAE